MRPPPRPLRTRLAATVTMVSMLLAPMVLGACGETEDAPANDPGRINPPGVPQQGDPRGANSEGGESGGPSGSGGF